MGREGACEAGEEWDGEEVVGARLGRSEEMGPREETEERRETERRRTMASGRYRRRKRPLVGGNGIPDEEDEDEGEIEVYPPFLVHAAMASEC